ncbi:MAG: 4-hydroxy-3-methylbut-2-enyl diphosphate reductase [Cyanobacteria bacterium]|nr:4-hydroxy-3-methylbut-2-enyl diphosphate reductase [Cyanobacteriota bacterium]
MTMTPSKSQQTQKTILLAEHHGFCHGVKKAVDKTLAVGQSSEKPVYVLGQLIHNQQVIDHLSEQSIQTVQSLDEVPEGSVCVIRTHGASPELIEAAEARQIEVSDATCPDVRLVQNKAIELAEEGYTVVVVGKADHPEVVGIRAHAKDKVPGAHIVCVNQVSDLQNALTDIPRRRIGIVSQTTQMEETFFDMVKELSKLSKELKVFNTICPATYFRQNAALELASKVDFMVVIGGKNSSNTTHLAEICKAEGTPTVHIETYQELEGSALLEKAQTVGVTAGASTPEWLVQEVIDYIGAL